MRTFALFSFALLTLYLFMHWVLPAGAEMYLEMPVEWFIGVVEYLWDQLFYTIERHTFLFTVWLITLIIGIFFILMNK